MFSANAYSEVPYSAVTLQSANVDVILTSGVEGQALVGYVEYAALYPVTGNTGTGSIGTVTVPVIANINTGVTGTGAVNSVGYALAYGVTGKTGTGSVGTIGVGVSVNAPSFQGIGSVGTVSVPTGTVVSAGSLNGTGSIAGNAGYVSVLINSQIDLSGVEGIGDVNNVSVPTDAVVVVTSVSATGSVGTASVTIAFDVVVAVTGITAAGHLGRVSVWGMIDPPVNGTWTNTPTPPVSPWGDGNISPPSPNWSAVAA